MKLKDTYSLEEKLYDNPRQHNEKQSHHFADKGPYSQSHGFSSSHLWMWKLDHREGWALKNWCSQNMCHWKMNPPDQEVSNILLEKSGEIAP